MDIFVEEEETVTKEASKRAIAVAKIGAFSLGVLIGIGARKDERPAVRALGIFGVVTAILVALNEVSTCTISFGFGGKEKEDDCDCDDDCGCDCTCHESIFDEDLVGEEDNIF